MVKKSETNGRMGKTTRGDGQEDDMARWKNKEKMAKAGNRLE